MAKIRITVTAVVEYDVNFDFYPKNSTAQQALEIDMANAQDDTFQFLDGDNVEWSFDGVVVSE